MKDGSSLVDDDNPALLVWCLFCDSSRAGYLPLSLGPSYRVPASRGRGMTWCESKANILQQTGCLASIDAGKVCVFVV